MRFLLSRPCSNLLRLLVCVAFLCPIQPGHSTAQDLKDEVEKIVTPAPSGQGAPINLEYEDYVPTVVFFESAPPPPPSPFKKKIAEKKGIELEQAEPQTVFGRLFRPSGDGPYPGIVLLHGANGIWDWNDVWATRLMDWGYVVLDVDSMTPRGLYPHNSGVGKTLAGTSKRHVGAFVRSLDAIGAARYLARLRFVDDGRIGALGMSQGGSTVLYALGDASAAGEFHAGVALYPPCDAFKRFSAPLLVLLGEADMWVHVGRCKENLGSASATNDVTLKLYPDVHHVFDLDAPERRVAGRLLRYDAPAAKDAIARVRAFLSEHLGGAP